MSAAPTTTPKRKRGVETSITPVAFNFDLSRSPEDGGDSPRSRVVHKFRGLALESSAFDEGDDEEGEDQARGGGGAAEPGYAGLDGEYSYRDDLPASKRSRPDEAMQDADGSNDGGGAASAGTEEVPRVPLPEVVADEPASEESQGLLPLPDGDGGLRRAYPSVNRLSDSISRSSSKKKKRAGTPPPPSRRKQEAASSDSDQEAAEGMEIVEPIRAALTWREDEITIYDPEDEDDDGTGINGVGFKPTPALAHARVMKRRQQLAEYRKREESEARAKRSQRRRGGVGGAGARRSTPSPEQIQARRKVRFMDSDKLAFIATKS